MATRNPADVSQPNFKGCDWYEPVYGDTCQKVGGISVPGYLTSDVIYGHNGATPIQVTYPT